MKIPSSININSFNYNLPQERIAKYPLEKRENSRLLYYQGGKIENRFFYDLPELLSTAHHLVFNDTKVIRARLLFKKTTGAEIEIFLLEPHSPSSYLEAFQETAETVWKCLIGNAKKWRSGLLEKQVESEYGSTTLRAELLDAEHGGTLVKFSWNSPSLCFSQIIQETGLTPLPPYLHREAEASDIIRYQTVYSDSEGSVAAPTAGLHFSSELLDRIKSMGVKYSRLTLHVGAGTFIPVKGDDAVSHAMHSEHFVVSLESLKELNSRKGKFIPVGTTSLRTLESLYWLGVKILHNPDIHEFHLGQWEAYGLRHDYTRNDTLSAIIGYLESRNLREINASTRIMIVPGYEFKMTDGLITNFHQPKSTLLLLIAAFIGMEWEKIYEYAMSNDYRFLSYGDSSFLLK